MNAKTCLSLLLLTALVVPVGAQPADVPLEKRELIYCADRMTPEERAAYRAKMRAASSLEERQAIRAAHRAEMQTRARQEPVEIYCDPPGRQWRGGRDK